MDGLIKIFDMDSLRLLKTVFVCESKNLIKIILLNEKNQSIAFTDGETIYILNLLTFQITDQVKLQHQISILFYHVTDDGQEVLLACFEAPAAMIMLVKKDNEFKMSGMKYQCQIIDFIPSQELVVGLFECSVLRKWKLRDLIDNYFNNKLEQITLPEKVVNFFVIPEKNLYLLLSKNSHKFLWVDPKSQQLLYQQEVKYPKLNLVYSQRQTTMAFNNRYCIVVNNILKRQSQDEEFEPSKFELYIYDLRNGCDIRLVAHMGDEKNSQQIFPQEENLNTLVANPVWESIFALGHSEGNIILIDVDRLQVLNIYQEVYKTEEDGIINNPILEIQFSEDGREMIVCTYYGCFSFYSSCYYQWHKLIQPNEQFFSNDYLPNED